MSLITPQRMMISGQYLAKATITEAKPIMRMFTSRKTMPIPISTIGANNDRRRRGTYVVASGVCCALDIRHPLISGRGRGRRGITGPGFAGIAMAFHRSAGAREQHAADHDQDHGPGVVH